MHVVEGLCYAGQRVREFIGREAELADRLIYREPVDKVRYEGGSHLDARHAQLLFYRSTLVLRELVRPDVDGSNYVGMRDPRDELELTALEINALMNHRR